MTVEIVTMETNHLFEGNPIAEQHKLRHRSIIERQSWDIPTIRDMEYDQYDNPATTYLVWRDNDGVARGVSRLYPTDRPFMLKDHFSYMVTNCDIPTGKNIWEGSRFCIDKTLTSIERKIVARELIVAYLEHGLKTDISQYIGLMYPVYWKNLFIDVGWEPTWFGDPVQTPDGKKSRAGGVFVSEAALLNAQLISGFEKSIISYGKLQKVEAAHANQAA